MLLRLSRVLSLFKEIRSQTETLCAPLTVEDCNLQAIQETSPVKWHLAHTSWFFENFLLLPNCPRYRVFNSDYSYLFNSYYEAVGKRINRAERGLLSRPGLEEIYSYRHHITSEVLGFFSNLSESDRGRLLPTLAMGIQHEQQHQELILTDIKYNFYINPLRPAPLGPVYDKNLKHEPTPRGPEWLGIEEGIQSIGCDGRAFSFDNEKPAHRVFLESFEISGNPVTQGEYLEFIEAGGYEKPEHWLSDGWDEVMKNNWRAPLYWEKYGNQYDIFTLQGMRPFSTLEPMLHLSFYEAAAFAQWKGLRLPTEFEWEAAAQKIPPAQKTGWDWTSSAYLGYPGFQPAAGALQEYNGKFMCNQMVLRGGSFATPKSALRKTYRNFFHPKSRWQFSGLRLAR
jgi:ergothioneine biosynthesis protein EgtB